MLFFEFFLCRTLTNFNKVFSHNLICNEKQATWPYKKHYEKTSPSLFQNTGEIANVREFEFERF